MPINWSIGDEDDQPGRTIVYKLYWNPRSKAGGPVRKGQVHEVDVTIPVIDGKPSPLMCPNACGSQLHRWIKAENLGRGLDMQLMAICVKGGCHGGSNILEPKYLAFCEALLDNLPEPRDDKSADDERALKSDLIAHVENLRVYFRLQFAVPPNGSDASPQVIVKYYLHGNPPVPECWCGEKLNEIFTFHEGNHVITSTCTADHTVDLATKENLMFLKALWHNFDRKGNDKQQDLKDRLRDEIDAVEHFFKIKNNSDDDALQGTGQHTPSRTVPRGQATHLTPAPQTSQGLQVLETETPSPNTLPIVHDDKHQPECGNDSSTAVLPLGESTNTGTALNASTCSQNSIASAVSGVTVPAQEDHLVSNTSQAGTGQHGIPNDPQVPKPSHSESAAKDHSGEGAAGKENESDTSPNRSSSARVDGDGQRAVGSGLRVVSGRPIERTDLQGPGLGSIVIGDTCQHSELHCPVPAIASTRDSTGSADPLDSLSTTYTAGSKRSLSEPEETQPVPRRTYRGDTPQGSRGGQSVRAQTPLPQSAPQQLNDGNQAGAVHQGPKDDHVPQEAPVHHPASQGPAPRRRPVTQKDPVERWYSVGPNVIPSPRAQHPLPPRPTHPQGTLPERPHQAPSQPRHVLNAGYALYAQEPSARNRQRSTTRTRTRHASADDNTRSVTTPHSRPQQSRSAQPWRSTDGLPYDAEDPVANPASARAVDTGAQQQYMELNQAALNLLLLASDAGNARHANHAAAPPAREVPDVIHRNASRNPTSSSSPYRWNENAVARSSTGPGTASYVPRYRDDDGDTDGSGLHHPHRLHRRDRP